MATDVIYNGVYMHNVRTRRWDQDVVLDQSGTDVIAHRFNLRFEALVHVQGTWTATAGNTAPVFTSLASGDIPIGNTYGALGQNVPSIYADITKRLGTARKTLTVKIGGEVVLQAVPASLATYTSSIDRLNMEVNNGPHPQVLAITHVVGNQVFRVEWAVTADMVRCDPASDTGYPGIVLSNRWAMQEVLDANFMVTRTIRGRLRLGANFVQPHWAKYLVVPGLERGFRRERIDFASDASGLDCDYSIVDKQVHYAAPYPATKMQASHTESTAMGINFFSEMRVHLEGPVNIDTRALIWRAMHVIDARLLLTSRSAVSDYVLEDASITDSIGEINAVDMFVRIRQLKISDPENTQIGHLYNATLGLPFTLPTIPGQTAPYLPNQSLPPNIYGYRPWGGLDGERRVAVLLLLNCQNQDPCGALDSHKIYDWDGEERDEEDGEGGNEFREIYTPESGGYIPAASDNKYSSDNTSGIYTRSRIESEYTFRDMKVALPLASSEVTADPTDDATVVCRIGRRQCCRVIRFDAERVGKTPKKPEAPETYTDGTFGSPNVLTGTRIKQVISVLPPVLSSDGAKQIYRVTAEIVYALNRCPQADETFNVGIHPYTNLIESDTATSLDLLEEKTP